jgi:excisionase family DNA binding protein
MATTTSTHQIHEQQERHTSMTDLTWITLKQAAERAQVSEATIRREAKAGRIRAAKVGGRRTWRFRPGWVDDWLEQAHESGLR